MAKALTAGALAPVETTYIPVRMTVMIYPDRIPASLKTRNRKNASTATCIPEKERPRKGWGWLMRNPRRVVEMPIKGQLGLYDIIVPKDDITEYPRAMALGSDGWDMVQKQINPFKK